MTDICDGTCFNGVLKELLLESGNIHASASVDEIKQQLQTYAEQQKYSNPNDCLRREHEFAFFLANMQFGLDAFIVDAGAPKQLQRMRDMGFHRDGRETSSGNVLSSIEPVGANNLVQQTLVFRAGHWAIGTNAWVLHWQQTQQSSSTLNAVLGSLDGLGKTTLKQVFFVCFLVTILST